MCNGLSRLKLDALFTVDVKVRETLGHSRKLAKFRCTGDCCKYFFNRVINRWNQLYQWSVDASSINAFNGYFVFGQNMRNKDGLLHGLILRELGLHGGFYDW